jgi:hypothetical protein
MANMLTWQIKPCVIVQEDLASKDPLPAETQGPRKINGHDEGLGSDEDLMVFTSSRMHSCIHTYAVPLLLMVSGEQALDIPGCFAHVALRQSSRPLHGALGPSVMLGYFDLPGFSLRDPIVRMSLLFAEGKKTRT